MQNYRWLQAGHLAVATCLLMRASTCNCKPGKKLPSHACCTSLHAWGNSWGAMLEVVYTVSSVFFKLGRHEKKTTKKNYSEQNVKAQVSWWILNILKQPKTKEYERWDEEKRNRTSQTQLKFYCRQNPLCKGWTNWKKRKDPSPLTSLLSDTKGFIPLDRSLI